MGWNQFDHAAVAYEMGEWSSAAVSRIDSMVDVTQTRVDTPPT